VSSSSSSSANAGSVALVDLAPIAQDLLLLGILLLPPLDTTAGDPSPPPPMPDRLSRLPLLL